MTDLNKALEDIGSIRRQVARTTEFRGYGPATLAATGGIALLAAGAQAIWLPNAAVSVSSYLEIWLATAILSGVTIGVQMVTRSQRMHSGMADEMIHMAVEQFLPAMGAGALITVVLVRFVPGSAWMLPGLWQVISSLGLFASLRFLPRWIALAAIWYMGTGLVCLAMGGNQALSPWAMGIPYGAGQMLVATILYIAAKGESDAA